MNATVVLSGRRNGTTHREVELLSSLPAELRLIGGLAVMCRVGSPHRTTVDLDAVARDLDALHPSIAGLALTSTGGGQYRFEGSLDLDVIDIAPVPTAELVRQLLESGADLSDLELNVVSHTWAHDTSRRLDVVAVDETTGERLAEATERLVATSAGLVAMKSTAIPLRASTRPEKRASDLYDLARLLATTNRLLGASDDSLSLGDLPEVLAATVGERLTGWFLDDAGRDRTYREVRRFDEPRVDLDEVADAVSELTS